MSSLNEHLLRNRQRLAIERFVKEAANLLSQGVQFADAVASASLGAEVRGALSARRPEANGRLLITTDGGQFVEVVRAYFEAHAGLSWYVLATHWTDAGAFIASSAELAKSAFDLLNLDGDTLYGCSFDRSRIFALDRTVEKQNSTFELFGFST